MNLPALASTATTPDVFIHNGKAVTTSQAVSTYFIKRHDNVIQKIECLDCSSEFRLLNFKETSYQRENPNGGNGITTKCYQMTKDGFVFLVMGFTGKKAARFKEAYIAEFNRMEAELYGKPALPKPELSINYPLSWYTDNCPYAKMRYIDRTQIQIDPYVLFDSPSPTMRILNELQKHGYEVEASLAEVKALKHIVSEMRWTLKEIARMAEKKSNTSLAFRI